MKATIKPYGIRMEKSDKKEAKAFRKSRKCARGRVWV